MKTALFVLIAFVGYGVEGIKIRAIRRRWIQYLPNGQTAVPQQARYYHWQSQNQRTPLFTNGRLENSYLNPDGMRFNKYGGRERYLAYLKNIGNTGYYQSINQNWPGMNGVAEGQSGVKSKYEEIMGQPKYQNWQAYSGSPVRTFAGYSGINGIGYDRQSVYQSWHNDGVNPAVHFGQSGIASGLGGIDKSLYPSWQNSVQGGQEDVSLEENEGSGHREQLPPVYNNIQSSDDENRIYYPAAPFRVNSGLDAHIGQPLYRNLQTSVSGIPLDSSMEDSGAISKISSHIDQNYATDRPTDISMEQTETNSALGADIDQPSNQHLQSPPSNDLIDVPFENSEVNPGYISQPIHESWPNSASIGLNGFSINQNGLFSEDKELTGHPMEPINKKFQNSEYQTNGFGDQSSPNLEYSGHVGYSLEDNPSNLGKINTTVEQTGPKLENEVDLSLGQDALNDQNYENTGHNYGYIGTDDEYHSDSPGNNGNYPVYHVKLTDYSKNHEMPVDEEENTVPVINGNENYPIPDDSKDVLITDGSKLNFPGQTPLKGTPAEFMPVGKEENVPPSKIAINVDGRTPINIMPENGFVPTRDRVFPFDQSEVAEASLKEKTPELNMDNLENSDSGPIELESIPFSSVNLPTFPDTLEPNLQNDRYQTPWNEIPTSLQQQPSLILPQSTQYENIEWNNPMTGNAPLRVNSEIQGMCDSFNSNANSIPRDERNYYGVKQLENTQDNEGHYYGGNVRPLTHTQDRINILKNTDNLNSAQNDYENKHILQNTNRSHLNNKFRRPNVAYLKAVANPIINNKETFLHYPPDILNTDNYPPPNYLSTEQKEIQSEILKAKANPSINTVKKYMLPSYQSDNGNVMNTYYYPQPKYYSPIEQQDTSIQSDILKAKGPQSIDTADKESIHNKPYFQQDFVTDDIPGHPQPMTSIFTKMSNFAAGHSKPRDPSLRSKPNQYIYQIQQAIEPELKRLYHSKCKIGHDEQLLKEIKELIDSIQVAHCQIS